MTTTPTKPANPNEAKPTLRLGKPTPEAKASPETKVSLKAICAEMRLDPRVAREKLRILFEKQRDFPSLRRHTNLGRHGNG
jgi:hypothetical protein